MGEEGGREEGRGVNGGGEMINNISICLNIGEQDDVIFAILGYAL